MFNFGSYTKIHGPPGPNTMLNFRIAGLGWLSQAYPPALANAPMTIYESGGESIHPHPPPPERLYLFKPLAAYLGGGSSSSSWYGGATSSSGAGALPCTRLRSGSRLGCEHQIR